LSRPAWFLVAQSSSQNASSTERQGHADFRSHHRRGSNEGEGLHAPTVHRASTANSRGVDVIDPEVDGFAADGFEEKAGLKR